MVEQFFLAVPRGCLRFVIVLFHDHTRLLLFITSRSGQEFDTYNIALPNNEGSDELMQLRRLARIHIWMLMRTHTQLKTSSQYGR